LHFWAVVDNQVCQTSLIIDVTPDMAPVSRFLVYLVKEDGEAVADSIRLPVKPKLSNEVSSVKTDTCMCHGKCLCRQVHTSNSIVWSWAADKILRLLKSEGSFFALIAWLFIIFD